MVLLEMTDTKDFMTGLLKNNIFDDFLLRQLNVHTFTQFEILGILDKDYFTPQQQNTINRKYCLWSEIKPFAFEIIKGKTLPKLIKIVFSLDDDTMQSLSSNASAMFLNVTFENNTITCSTGCSQLNFSLDRILIETWDNWILDFFTQNHIHFTKMT